jgi:hypothetical protein
MQILNIPTFREIKLNSFRPLCMNELGIRAVVKYNFPPFIDASCRREPDFQNPFPSISALCRQGTFAPNLIKGDIIVYMTVQGHYPPYNEKHHRIVAILQVEEIYDSHQQGQLKYSKLKAPIPSNCMVKGNLPMEFDKTAGNFKSERELKHFLKHNQYTQLIIGQRYLRHWDNSYLQKSTRWTCFVRTKSLYKNLDNPIPIFRKDFNAIFGKLPNTRTPNKISEKQFIELSKLIGLNVLFGNKTM